ncbi:DUF3737 family protein [Levilactobacillus acidifarinae]|uniref:Hydrogenase n=1 Tax=Levilactobacillus acidifarinae DSM 19394 = JCM 15949 TaxID=1423715 RepID=A0A0R1LUU8_9LACO|nr:DUF3737 family protein [Levilactobacillus acidifarinae]KRK96186.1 hypothetical protein FD25_GL002652 [Levilactobacillus acidifarinae DSM 19394]GEO69547.1 hypothetical protein LAC03_14570 [Levilactobacillus acidifarinae]
MKELNQQSFTGERALFQAHDLHITNSTFHDGESPLKHAHDLAIDHTIFKWKYPLWYAHHVTVDQTTWQPDAHAGIWYSQNLTMQNTTVRATKTFRHAQHLKLQNVDFADAGETLWWCDDVQLDHVTANGDYFGMNTNNVVAHDLKITGNYAFDGGKNIEVHNSTFITHDAFWNCDNVTIYDSTIIGEYLSWNTKNITFVNCWLESDQGLCYVDGLTMRNSALINTDLSFEYCKDIDATITTQIDSVKNPVNGHITAPSIGQVIFDDPAIDPAKTTITTQEANHD